MQLEGRKILLTGGTGGFGSVLRRVMEQRGAKVISAGREDGEDIAVDLSSVGDIARLGQELAGTDIDVLVNNAGLQYFGRTHEQSEAHIAAMVAVNFQAPLLLTRMVLPNMLSRGGGQIVNIGSAFAGVPFPYFSVYCAAKGGLRSFSQSLRREYAGRGITVTYASPRAMKTSMSAGPVSEFLTRTKSAMDDPHVVAEKIVSGIEAGRKEINIGTSEQFFAALNALCPAMIDKGLRSSGDIAEDILSAV